MKSTVPSVSQAMTCVSDAANRGVQPLLANVRLRAAQFDLLNLAVVGGGELVEDSACLQCKYCRDQGDQEDESDSGILVDFDVSGGVFGAASD